MVRVNKPPDREPSLFCNKLAFEDLYEEDKAEILFEKKFLNYLQEQLGKQIDSNVGDMSESVANVFEILSSLLNMPELLGNKVILVFEF